MNVSLFPPCRRKLSSYSNSGALSRGLARLLFILDRCERDDCECHDCECHDCGRHDCGRHWHKSKARGVYPFAHFNPALFLFHLVAQFALRVAKFADGLFQLWVCKCVHATQIGMAMLNASRCGGLAFYARRKMGVL